MMKESWVYVLVVVNRLIHLLSDRVGRGCRFGAGPRKNILQVYCLLELLQELVHVYHQLWCHFTATVPFDLGSVEWINDFVWDVNFGSNVCFKSFHLCCEVRLLHKLGSKLWHIAVKTFLLCYEVCFFIMYLYSLKIHTVSLINIIKRTNQEWLVIIRVLTGQLYQHVIKVSNKIECRFNLCHENPSRFLIFLLQFVCFLVPLGNYCS